MYDPQWLDMNYDRYYFIPWPDSQYFDNVDDEDADIVRVENGAFVGCAWLLEEDLPDFEYETDLTESL